MGKPNQIQTPPTFGSEYTGNPFLIRKKKGYLDPQTSHKERESTPYFLGQQDMLKGNQGNSPICWGNTNLFEGILRV